jgi:hypothetical protein
VVFAVIFNAVDFTWVVLIWKLVHKILGENTYDMSGVAFFSNGVRPILTAISGSTWKT